MSLHVGGSSTFPAHRRGGAFELCWSFSVARVLLCGAGAAASSAFVRQVLRWPCRLAWSSWSCNGLRHPAFGSLAFSLLALSLFPTCVIEVHMLEGLRARHVGMSVARLSMHAHSASSRPQGPQTRCSTPGPLVLVNVKTALASAKCPNRANCGQTPGQHLAGICPTSVEFGPNCSNSAQLWPESCQHRSNLGVGRIRVLPNSCANRPKLTDVASVWVYVGRKFAEVARHRL